jgi:inner membrane protein
MLSRTHDLGAFASLLTAAIYFPQPNLSLATIIVATIANIVGALLPDLDQSGNRLWDLLPGGDFIGKILKKVFLGHRSLSHSFLGLFLVYRLFLWLIPRLFNRAFVDPIIVIIALMIGYISHLLLDALTEEGLPLFFPFRWKTGFPPIRSWRLKTGHWFENFIVLPLLVIYILYLLLDWKLL